MTLRQFLKDYNFKLSHNKESELGVLISERYTEETGLRAVKIKVNYCPLNVNDYSIEFLDSCIDDIIGFFTGSTLADQIKAK